MDFSKLSYENVISMAEQLKSSSSEMETLLNELKTLFENVGNEQVWSGTAASATKERFDELSAKFPEFSSAVDDCYKYLSNVVETYKSVDAAVTGQQ